MRNYMLLLAGIVSLGYLRVASAEQTVAPKPVLVDRVVAVVNDQIISWRDLVHRKKRLTAALASAKTSLPAKQLHKRALDDLINDALISDVASKLRITASKQDIDQAIAQLKASNKINDTQLAHALQAQGYTMARYREELAHQIVRVRTINIAVRPRMQISEDELKAEYAKRVATLGKANVKPYTEARPALHEELFQRNIIKYTRMWLGELRAMAYVSVRP